MAKLVYDSRDQVEVYRFSWPVTFLLPAIALLLQAFLPVRARTLNIIDLPLLVTIFFAVSRRNPVSGLATGAVLGLAQDALTHLPLGVCGIAKTLIGYIASSLGARIDVENPGSRFLMTFAFYLIHNALYILILRGLANQPLGFHWAHEMIAALVNALLAVAVFAALDPLKVRE
ncbi:MAG TPA: rod shape-determining protein MreD [Terriglobales bacterium]